jgi:ketosteroid isomerase-like protein
MHAAGAGLFHVRDRKVKKFVVYLDREGALADLGLTEQAMPEESTTSDLAALIQRIVDAANTWDLDAAMTCYAPDGVYDMSPVGLGIREGRAAIREHFQEWWGGYEEYEHELEELQDLGEGIVFVTAVQRGRLPGSAGWVQLRYPVVGTVRDCLIERITVYTDIDQARAAAARLAESRG